MSSKAGYFAGRIDLYIGRIEATVLVVSILVMAANTIANVIGRYFFSQSIYFSEELNQILIITVTFFGLGYVTRQGRHIRMSAVYDVMPFLAKRALMVFIAITTAAVMFLLAWYSYQYLERLAARGRITPVLQIPVYLTYILVPVGFILTGIQYLLTAFKNIFSRDKRVYLSFTAEDVYEDLEIDNLLSDRTGDPEEQVHKTRGGKQ